MMGAAKLQRWQAPENRLPKEDVEKVWTEGFPVHLANLEKLCVQPSGFTSTGTTAGKSYVKCEKMISSQERQILCFGMNAHTLVEPLRSQVNSTFSA